MTGGYIFDYGGTLDTGGQHWGQVLWHAYERHRVPVSEAQFREAYVHAERTLGRNPIIRPDFTFRQTLETKLRLQLEFLGLKPDSAYSESKLENAIISKMQQFLLELGKGFLFEARQKRFTFEEENFYVDLVFYNRLLHCNVIVELKNDEFRHEYLGQLNAYVYYYKENEMHEGDNPPVGILLCTRKGKKMVEYAIAGMDNNLFVSTYMLQLPDKATLEQFLLNEIDK